MSSDTGAEAGMNTQPATGAHVPCVLDRRVAAEPVLCVRVSKSLTAAIKDADGMWRARRGRGHGLGAGFIRRSAYCWTRLRA